MQYAINYSSKKRPTLFSQKIFVSKNKTKQTKKRISDYSKIGYSFLTPPRRLQRSEKGFFIYKNKNKVGRNYDCDISRKKNQKMENIFLCLCMLCINQIFLILAPGLKPPLFWLKNNPFVIPMFRLHFFYTSDQKFLKKTISCISQAFFACDVLTQSVEK